MGAGMSDLLHEIFEQGAVAVEIEHAKLKGRMKKVGCRRMGRPPKLTPTALRKAARLLEGGVKLSVVAEDIGVARSTLYAAFARLRNADGVVCK